MLNKSIRYAAMILLLLVIGCGLKVVKVQHPGALNQFDSDTADDLLLSQNVIEGLSAHIADYPSAKGAINDARAAYTIAENTFFLWRCAVGAAVTVGPTGQPCPKANTTTQAQVKEKVSTLKQNVVTAQTAAGVK